jgi:hypothetical protein
MADLQDVEEILEGGRLHRPVDREVLATAIQALLFHQVIYEDLDRIGHRAYDALKAHRGFFERYLPPWAIALCTAPGSRCSLWWRTAPNTAAPRPA